MRVKTRSDYIVVFSLILLFAILLLCFAWAGPVAQADLQTEKPYLQAKILSNGDTIPSAFSYGDSIVCTFSLHQKASLSDNNAKWEFAPASDTLREDFEIRYYDLINEISLNTEPPTVVGTYRVGVYAKKSISGYSNGYKNMLSIEENDPIAEKTFRIVHFDCALYSDYLDRTSIGLADPLVLGAVSDFYDLVTDGASLRLDGEVLDPSKYTLSVERSNGESFVGVMEITTPGLYRLKAVLDPSVTLDSLGLSDRTISRVFSVTSATLGLRLNQTEAYADRLSTPFTLDASSLSKLSSASYKTEIFRYDTDENALIGRAVDASLVGALSFPTPNPPDPLSQVDAGNYLYRVVFTADWPEYDIKADDEIILPFTVYTKPYVIRYSYANEYLDECADFEVNNDSEDSELHLSIVFCDTTEEENPISGVNTDNGRKYSVKYQRYYLADDVWAWRDHTADYPTRAGRYRALIHFNESATIVGGTHSYVIEAGTDLVAAEFQVIIGEAHLEPIDTVMRYASGTSVIPSFTIGEIAVAQEKYDIVYYDSSWTALGTAPSAVGSYFFKVNFKDDLSIIPADDPLREVVSFTTDYLGKYVISYTPVVVNTEDDAIQAFINGDTDLAIPVLYDTVYYEADESEHLYRKLDSAPREAGHYMMRGIFTDNLPDVYHYAQGDFAQYAYEIPEEVVDKLFATFEFTSLKNEVVVDKSGYAHVRYDGGVKIPDISFRNAPGEMTEFVDYQVNYFRWDDVTSAYIGCEYPIHAGMYRVVVNYPMGGFDAWSFYIDAKKIDVRFRPTTESVDLVYDGTQKNLEPFFFDAIDGFAVSYDYNPLQYAIGDGALSPSYQCVDAGSYKVSVSLPAAIAEDIKLNSSALYSFEIVPLQVNVRFTVKSGYEAMWNDGAVIIPTVSYIVMNGEKYKDMALETIAGLAEDNPLKIVADRTPTYNDGDVSEDSVTEPGTYKQSIIWSDVKNNIRIAKVSSGAESNESDPAYNAEENFAYQIFHIYRRDVSVKFVMSDDSEVLYDKGVDTPYEVSEVRFYKCISDNEAENPELPSDFLEEDEDYQVVYYNYGGPGRFAGKLQDPPYQAGEYYARVELIKEKSEIKDHYTFVDGKYDDENHVQHDLGDRGLVQDAYVMYYFSISSQTEFSVRCVLPKSKSFIVGYECALSVEFYDNDGNKILDADLTTEGAGAGFLLSYQKKENGVWRDLTQEETPPSTKGIYRAKITFQQNNCKFRYVPTADDAYSFELALLAGSGNYVKQNDVIYYTFEIVDAHLMTCGIQYLQTDGESVSYPNNRYYSGTAKECAPIFTVTDDDDLESRVALRNLSDYKLTYYKKDVETDTYEACDVPVLPGEYRVKITFLRDILDYKLSEDDLKIAANKERTFDFTILRADLILTGFTADSKPFDNDKKASIHASAEGIVLRVINGHGAFEQKTVSLDTIKDLAFFDSEIPGQRIVSIAPDTLWDAFEIDNALYTLASDEVMAEIYPKVITVTPDNGQTSSKNRRQYDPYYPYAEKITYTLDAEEEAQLRAFAGDYEDLFVGSLSHSVGADVGPYLISLGTLALNDEYVINGAPLSSYYTIRLMAGSYFVIYKRKVYFEVANVSKLYGDEDPQDMEGQVSSARGTKILNGHELAFDWGPKTFDDVGDYDISFTNIRILASGIDVSFNYEIYFMDNNGEERLITSQADSVKVAICSVLPRMIKIVAQDQTGVYITPFVSDLLYYKEDEEKEDDEEQKLTTVKVLSYDYQKKAYEDAGVFPYVRTGSTDRISGSLIRKKREEDQNNDTPDSYIISPERVKIVNAAGKDITKNYDIIFESATHTILTSEIELNLDMADEDLWKYYGDPDPIIRFTPANTDALGSLKFSPFSTVTRRPGEDVTNYPIQPDEQNVDDYIVLDGSKDVTHYFTFKITNIGKDQKFFEIKPREVTIKVVDAVFENTGRAVEPSLIYLTAEGNKMSDAVVAKMKNKYVVPSVEYIDGDNVLTPVVDGEEVDDRNFEVTLKSGTITFVYLQNRVTATMLPDDDEIIAGREYILSGINLYKSVKFYKLETANGEQPSREIEISLPLDETVKGDNLVAIALYKDGSVHPMSFKQEGNNLVYKDSNAYYVVVAEVQNWFIIVWGVAIILGIVVIYFLVILIIKLVNKSRAKQEAMEALEEEEKQKRRRRFGAKRGFGSIDEGVDAQRADDLAYIDNMFRTDSTDSGVAKASTVGATHPSEWDSSENTDDLFSSEAVSYVEETPRTTESSSVADDDSIDLLSDDLVSDAPVVTETTPVASKKTAQASSAKKEKEGEKDNKKEAKKESKKDIKKDDKKADDPSPAPKGFKPMSFVPKGNKSSVYAPTRSYKDDLFVNEESDEALSEEKDNNDEISLSSATEKKPNDDLILAKSSGFTIEEPDEHKHEEDDENLY